MINTHAPQPKRMHTRTHTYIEVRDVVFQQDLNIPNTLFSPDKGEGDHSLCRQNIKNTTHKLVYSSTNTDCLTNPMKKLINKNKK